MAGCQEIQEKYKAIQNDSGISLTFLNSQQNTTAIEDIVPKTRFGGGANVIRLVLRWSIAN
jgi:hypothetical protein